jgi:hypothetical protein
MLKEEYRAQKNEYLELCWRYNLPPRDLTLLLMGNREIEAEDRIRLIQLVIALSNLERRLGSGAGDDQLFAPDESSYSHSAIFTQCLQ